MMTLVSYDIQEDRIRGKIFEACKDYGLAHFQYSAFIGKLNHNRRDELKQRIKKTLGQKKGKILVLPICDKDVRLMEVIEVRD